MVLRVRYRSEVYSECHIPIKALSILSLISISKGHGVARKLQLGGILRMPHPDKSIINAFLNQYFKII
jgi:hypothetical protein